MNTDIEYMAAKGWLPKRVSDRLMNFEGVIDEVRLRENGAASITVGQRTLRTGLVCTADELDTVLASLCGGSMHTCGEGIRHGRIDLGGGWRAGVCGQAVCDKGSVMSIKRVTSVCIRIPHTPKNCSRRLYERLTATGRPTPTLIYSPPGHGKTTLLRDLCVLLTHGDRPYRVALIDSNGELYDAASMFGGTLDVLTGYPKSEAIELATRTMNPECLVCDELGNAAETDALLDVQNSGVPLIASAHAISFEGLKRRPNIKRLCDAGMFGLYVGIERHGDELTFDFNDA